MSKFKSEFFNLMLERGFYNQCTNEDGFDTYLYECEKAGKRPSVISVRIPPATACMSGISFR